MSDREKLFDLHWETEQMRFMRSSIEACVDNLISNGVTVQKWIPVSERMPDEHDSIFAELYGTVIPRDTKIKKKVHLCDECYHALHEIAKGVSE